VILPGARKLMQLGSPVDPVHILPVSLQVTTSKISGRAAERE